MNKMAVVLNFCSLLFLSFLLLKHGLPKEGEDILFLMLFAIAPVVSIFALWNVGGNNWISLYFQRKALEEQRKIDELNTSRKS